jgi:hypothetical protein
LKDKVYKRNPHTLHETEEDIQEETPMDFPSTTATCEPVCVLALQCMFLSTRGTFSMPPLNW